MKKNIALMAGGNSGEAVVSLRSAVEVEKNIDSTIYNVYKIVVLGKDWYYEKDDKKYFIDKNDFSLSIDGNKINFDGVFMIIHGNPGENGLMQGYLEMMDIPCASCSSLVSAITFDKVICNAVVRDLDIVKVAKNVSFYKHSPLSEEEILSKLSLPLFVKPSEGGSSIGMSKVKEKYELAPAIKTAFEVHERLIIEEFIKGRELTCGVIETKNEVVAFPITEIIPKKEFFDYEAKYDGSTAEITPAEVSDEIRIRVQETAKKIYRGLNCKGVCRIDFILKDDTQELYFLEVNTIPGQSEQSIVPQQVRKMGLTTKILYSKMLEEIL
ncbi:Vancomycin C-type resistance protein VanC [bioreactor metagenome]|uniref:Vancomycin C-type resistance protein VanC n=1 Tax=bioreactor metagenome TaxID=1076179 RepID=A0A644V3F4_9ZZZZ|nr:D-alanine--D-alanine ligase [Bacteroidaceae bacterium]MEA5098934.1 D-alanine--D-alanine ligase [Bacteroidales bacterium]